MALHKAVTSSQSTEWLTPEWLLVKVYEVLGTVDLDPCSNDRFRHQVIAEQHYSEEDDGLVLPWRGTVYMNPPYGRKIGRWVRKLLANYRKGNVPAAIALVPASTEAIWFRELWDYTICFLPGKVDFLERETGEPGKWGCPTPIAAVYLGPRIGLFYNVFKGVGPVVRKIKEHKVEMT